MSDRRKRICTKGKTMIREPIIAIYEGNGVVRLREQPPELQEEQELLVTIVPIPVGSQSTDKTRPTPLAYFHELVNRLRHYEEKYGMSSEEFYRRFQSGAIQEGPFDYFDWRILWDGYRRMQERFGFSRERLADV
jgi:hypothetical protein